MKSIRNIIAFLLALLLLPVFSVSAEEAPQLTAEGEKALIYNLEYDRILWSEGENDLIAPASFTKIMTSVLGYEYDAAHPDTTVTVSKYVAEKSTGTRIGLKEGEVLPFRELLAAMIVGSANDAALAIAETVAGSEAEFIAAMNAKAKELGMENTYFANPTGMDQTAMNTTLRDMAKLCAYAYRINDLMLMTDTVEHTVPATNLSKARKLRTKNLLVDTNPYTGYHTPEVMGMNAGSTVKAGFVCATTVEKGGLTFIVLVANGKYQKEIYSSFTDARTLVRHALDHYRLTTVVQKDTALSEMKVELGSNADSVMLICESEIRALLPVDYDPSLLTQKIRFLRDSLTAPVSKGLAVGTLEVYYNAQLLGTADVVTQRAIEKSGFEEFTTGLQAFFFHPSVQTALRFSVAALALLILFLVALVIFRSMRKNAEERKIVKEYLDDERKRFKEDQKRYHQQKRKRKAEKRRRFKENQREFHRQQAAKRKQEHQSKTPQNKPSQNNPAPNKPPQQAPKRPGDEYYNN